MRKIMLRNENFIFGWLEGLIAFRPVVEHESCPVTSACMLLCTSNTIAVTVHYALTLLHQGPAFQSQRDSSYLSNNPEQ